MLKWTIIGESEEFDVLGTCVGDLERLRDKIQKYEGHFRDILFDGLTDDEVMELIYKSNQLESEYNPVFSHLPVMKTNELWYKHTVTLAESTDSYNIVVFEEGGKLKFVWQKWKDRKRGLKNENNVFVEYDDLYAAINEFLLYIKTITLKT